MFNKDYIEGMVGAFAQEATEEFEDTSVPFDHVWIPPRLNVPQLQVFNNVTDRYILADGEKGTGKSIGCLHKVVNSAYKENNGVNFIITPTSLAADSGVVYDLCTLVLPLWEMGDYQLRHEGIRQKPKTHHSYLGLTNRYGTRSEITFFSIPNDAGIDKKVKGPAPDMTYIEELTDYDSDELFNTASAQIGRKVGKNQQLISSCNPKGPSHWVYDVFINEELRIKQSARYYHSYESNAHNMPPDYQERLRELYRKDPVKLSRLISGDWVDTPDGDALFLSQFDPYLHVKGEEGVNSGIIPTKGADIIVGYDLGQVFSEVTFMQRIPFVKQVTVPGPNGQSRVEDRYFYLWTIFDEISISKQRVSYRDLTRVIVRKMDWWNDFVGHYFNYLHITDDSATTQYRPNTGSYDADDIMKFSEGRIRFRAAPKGRHSREARVRAVSELLVEEELYVSKQCNKTIGMFNNLPEDPDEPGTPKKKHSLGHRFDSLSYPIFYFEKASLEARGLRVGNTKAGMMVSY